MNKGPSARIELSCEYCDHCKTTGRTVMGFGDQIFYSYCDKVNKSIGQDTYQTPLWCPFLEKAVRQEIKRAEERLKEIKQNEKTPNTP
jgi:hypothetical protein